MFSMVLTCMPLDKIIDLGIDLVPSIQPVSVPPYRMTPAELKEKLQEFLDKKFIKPGVSPWGALVLYL